MKNQCLCCQSRESDEPILHGYHPGCTRRLFGAEIPPKVSFSTIDIVGEAQKMVGKMSVSGVQPKLSVVHDLQKACLSVVQRGGEYILKPQTDVFPMLPENENLCMQIASVFGIDVPSHGLLLLTDGRFAYGVRRFDRTKDGSKLHQEDFQQLLEADDKYEGSHERIANFIKKHSVSPMPDLVRLYERSILFFVLGNGDAHLKNFSLIRTRASGYQLSPAYDIVSSRLALPAEQEELCLSVQGKKNRISRKDFLRLSKHFGLAEGHAEHVFDHLKHLEPKIGQMIRESFLSKELKDRFIEIFRQRMERLFTLSEP
ncbi:MAG: hypothetical protein B6245_06500 [Desulfobacteraceae bacterium 4572_88]|nr:MAG: hypothetical protein B6245_06500 [Desulfobacteraceae bacterium 4572_88]